MFLQPFTKLVFVDRDLSNCQSSRPPQRTIRKSAYITVGRRVNSGTGWFDHLVERSCRSSEVSLDVSRRRGLAAISGLLAKYRVSDAIVASMAVSYKPLFITWLTWEIVPTLTALSRRES
jgi:hypothetical protein